MSTTLKTLRREVYQLIDPDGKLTLRTADIDQYINDEIRELSKEFERLQDSAITTTVADQERYDLTSSTIWMQDSALVDTTETLNTTVTDSITTIVTDATASYAYAVGQLIKLDDEIMRVTAFSTPNLTVVRAVAGTTAAAHTAGIAIYVGAALSSFQVYRVDYDGYEVGPIAMDEFSQVTV